MRLILIFLIFLSSNIYGQTVESIEKNLYYEKTATALDEAQDFLAKSPTDDNAWYLLSQAYLAEKDIDGLKDTLSSAPASLSDNPLLNIARGELLLSEKKPDSAELYFSKAMSKFKKKETYIPEAIARAQINQAAGNADKAIELINLALKRDKKNPDLYLLLGDAYRKKGNGSEAFSAYSKALELDSKYAAAHYRQGKIFVSQQNPEIYLKHFTKAVELDPSFAPAWYELYYHYYFKDPARAMNYLQKYIANSDPSPDNDYMLTDLLYTSKKYDEAINSAKTLLQKDSLSEPRLYKLIAYSYLEQNKHNDAYAYMQQYFSRADDSVYIAKDFETMANIYSKMENPDSSNFYFSKAFDLEKDTAKKLSYAQKLADFSKQIKDYDGQAKWLEAQYQLDSNVSNLVIFNWGVARYMAQQYDRADSVFSLYTVKYPEQHFGYYWRARANAAIDTAMAQGLAVSHYTKVIEMLEKDTMNDVNKKRLIESYGYLAAYKANTEKDFAAAITYFEKLLAIEPENADAKKYIEILRKSASKSNDVSDK